jgi:hypothetical protein
LVVDLLAFDQSSATLARCMPGDLNRKGKIGDGCNDNQLTAIKSEGS